jgi:hypothetical protein
MPLSTADMRVFASDCSRWAEQASNPSNRETILRVARHWLNTASGIERRLDDGFELACADLKRKLD